MSLIATILSDVRASKTVQEMGRSKTIFKTYRQGDKVKGNIVNESLNPHNWMPVFVSADGYKIPKVSISDIQKDTETYQDAKEVKNSDFYDVSSTKKIAEKYKNFNVESILGDAKYRSKYAVNGGLIGGASGLIYAMAKQQNKPLFVLGGILVGGIIGSFIYKQVNKNVSKDSI